MKGGEMPKRSSFQNDFWNKEDYQYWLNSLKTCEITNTEFKKIHDYLLTEKSINTFNCDFNIPIEVTYIVEDNYGVTFNGIKEQIYTYTKNGVTYTNNISKETYYVSFIENEKIIYNTYVAPHSNEIIPFEVFDKYKPNVRYKNVKEFTTKVEANDVDDVTIKGDVKLYMIVYGKPILFDTFKKSEQFEAVEFKTWCDGLSKEQRIKSKFKFMVNEYSNQELYEIFKTKKNKL